MRDEVVEEKFEMVAYVLEVRTTTDNSDSFFNDEAFVNGCKYVRRWLYILI